MDVRIDRLRFDREGRTVLEMIAGLERPAAGTIRIGDTTARLRSRADVAVVFQEQVFLSGSVRENLALGLRLRGIPRVERDTRIEEAADLFGIRAVLGRAADRLSGGEARRVSLARAFCLRARVALLDEPLAGLDRATYARLLDELPRLLKAFDTTTILVTHDHREALYLAEDLVVLVDGRVRAAGQKSDVVMNPRSAEVAEILGYAVLEWEGQLVGVRTRDLQPGPGPVQFSIVVEQAIDVVQHQEIAGVIGSTRVHVMLPREEPPPNPGESLIVHARQIFKLI
jgi:putative spermidine/putrescine transport system ATP-binding protein